MPSTTCLKRALFSRAPWGGDPPPSWYEVDPDPVGAVKTINVFVGSGTLEHN